MSIVKKEHKQSFRISEKSKTAWRRRLFMASFLAWPIINFFIFYVYVHIDSFALAFQRKEPITGEVTFTFFQFQRIWQELTTGGDLQLGLALRNTLLFFGSGIFLSLPISLFFGYFIYKKIAGYRLFRTVTYLPVIISSAAMVILFKYAVQDYGPLNTIMEKMGMTYQNPITNEATSIWIMLFYHVVFGLGGNIIVWGGAMNGIDHEILEAGQIDGCNWFQEFYRLILPMIWPTISTVIVLGTVGFLGASGPVLVFTKGEYGTRTLSYMLYEMIGRVGNGREDFYMASAMGLCMTLITFPLAMFVKHIVYGEKKEDR